MNESQNDLERAFAKAARGTEAHPELFRQLRKSELSFLLPYHPEIEGGEFELKNGAPVPPFVIWQNKEGAFIPVFTSEARADAAVAKQTEDQHFKRCPYSVGTLKGEILFKVLTVLKRGVVLNPLCGTEEVYLDKDAVRLLGDGSILEPIKPVGPPEDRDMTVVLPDDYPTEFLEPLFRFLSERPEVKAAWLFRLDKPRPPLKVEYGFILVASGNWEQVKQDFGVVAHSYCMDKPEMYYLVQVTHPADPVIKDVLAPMHPFYVAPGYQVPCAKTQAAQKESNPPAPPA